MKISVPKDISRPFIYACMGFGNSRPDENSLQLVEECSKLVLETAEPRLVYREFNMEEVEALMPGNDLPEHLAGCEKCVFMALTLGISVDRLIRRAEISDMAKAVALDACASSLVEDLCDGFSGQLAEQYGADGFSVTGRFSPGYGDLPLNFQKVFEHLLDMHRQIGLSHSREYLLTPRKSVTAVIGIRTSEAGRGLRTSEAGAGVRKVVTGMSMADCGEAGNPCENCRYFEGCTFRLNGVACGRKK